MRTLFIHLCLYRYLLLFLSVIIYLCVFYFFPTEVFNLFRSNPQVQRHLIFSRSIAIL